MAAGSTPRKRKSTENPHTREGATNYVRLRNGEPNRDRLPKGTVVTFSNGKKAQLKYSAEVVITPQSRAGNRQSKGLKKFESRPTLDVHVPHASTPVQEVVIHRELAGGSLWQRLLGHSNAAPERIALPVQDVAVLRSLTELGRASADELAVSSGRVDEDVTPSLFHLAQHNLVISSKVDFGDHEDTVFAVPNWLSVKF
jgi:hypothetical protein